jgi:hypothetical protein
MVASPRPRTARGLLAALSLIVIAGLLATPALALAARIAGRVVVAGHHAVAASDVTLYAGGAAGARALGSTRTDARGRFAIAFAFPSGRAVLYLVASGGATPAGAALRLMTVAGPAGRTATPVRINELTTVSSAYSLAQFLRGRTVRGPSPGLPNAAATFPSLVNPATGAVSPVLARAPNGTKTNTLATFRTLGGMLAYCARASCRRLLGAARPPGARPPRDTLEAVLDIALHPANNVRRIFALPRSRAYGAGLRSAPAGWVLSLKHTAGGFNGPGRMAFDSRGNIWVTNNFAGSPPNTAAGLGVVSLDPTGRPRNGSPVTGGGIQGNWWGIAVDGGDRVWLSNYTGSDTTSPFSPQFQGGDAASLFTSGGIALSPPAGFQTGGLRAPQGIAVDQVGNVLIANHVGGTVTRYLNGDPARAQVISGGGLAKPFGIQIDARGDAWVTDNAIDVTDAGAVTRIDRAGQAHGPITGGGLRSPQGLSIDSVGNVWVANLGSRSVTQIDPQGRIAPRSPIRVPSFSGPWATAVDGNDNVWVTSFVGSTLTQLCGRNRSHCPPGARTGDPISPRVTGFTNGHLQHLTAVQIDESGNVWVANNWSSVSPIIGGDGLVEFIGAAPPVRTPLIGPPRRP